MRLRNLGMIALVATTITLTACSSSEADSSESQATADASSREEVSENSEEAAEARLAAELQAQGWNGPLDLDASQLDYGMGEVTIEGEVIPMTVTCGEIPYDPRPFAVGAFLEGTDSAGCLITVSLDRSLDIAPWDPNEFLQDIDGYDGHENGSLTVVRETDGKEEAFILLSPSYGDPYAEALPVVKATDDWRFSAVATSDEYTDRESDLAFPIEVIGMCNEDWKGPYRLSTEEWDEISRNE